MEAIKEKLGTLAGHPVQLLLFSLIIGSTVFLLATPYYMYAVLPTLGFLLLLLLGNAPRIGYYMVIFMVPFDVYRELLGKALSFSKILGGVLLLIVTLHMLFGRISLDRLKSNIWPWFVFYFIAGVVSTFLSDFRLTSFDQIRQTVATFAFFFLTLALVDRDSFFKTLPRVLMASITLSAILSIVGYVFDIPVLSMDIRGENMTRATGGSYDPNFNAAVISFGLPLLFQFHYMFKVETFKKKLLFMLIILLNVVGITLTFSRAGGIVLLVVLIFSAAQNLYKLRPIHLGFVMISFFSFIIAMALLVPSSYWTRQKSITDTADESLQRRYSYLVLAGDAIKKNPIFGYGPGTFHDLYAQTLNAVDLAGTITEDYFRDAHNTYIEILVGRGVLGLIIYMGITVTSFLNFYKAKKNLVTSGRKEEATIVNSYMLAFLAMSIFILFLSMEHHKYIWISIALSQVALNFSRVDGNSSK
ncbi:MAG: O-antigen ligase family protein [Nitrospirae bacterium]|nr:O-antigen ligase family protein [Nitrospirota bacterium]